MNVPPFQLLTDGLLAKCVLQVRRVAQQRGAREIIFDAARIQAVGCGG